MTVPLEDVCGLLEKSFDCLLILDDNAVVIHMSDQLAEETTGGAGGDLRGKPIGELLEGASLETVESTMRRLEEDGGPQMLSWTTRSGRPPITLRAVMQSRGGGRLFMFWGNRFTALEDLTDVDTRERAKELACIYAVAKWIERSASIDDFVAHVPRYLSDGMQYPEHARVHCIYQGREYGARPDTERFIKSDLVLDGDVRGSLCVWYDRDDLELLPEEQRMLDRVAKMLVNALERQRLRQSIDERSEELRRQRKKLETVNSYLDDVHTGLQESKNRLDTVFQAIPDTVAIIDRDRNVVMTNTDKYVPGNKCYTTFFDSDRPCVDCRLARVRKEKTPITLEIQHDDRFYEVQAIPIFDGDDEIDGIVEFYRDISDKRNYEQQLQQADKLASLGQLVSGIGHEINNPNQFIRGNIKIIRQAMDDILPLLDTYHESHPDLKIARLDYGFFREHIITLIDDMANGSARIKGIVEDLKRFARRDEGLLIDTVDLNALIRESVRLVHNQIHKTADITLDLADDLPEFTGNVQKIQQVFVNLIINAGQAIPEGRRGVIEVATVLEDGAVVARVSDNGSGMSEGTIKQIFDPFFTTKRARGGTGLGLSIVYRIIEEHGGTVSVTSTVGEGTTFTMTFPLKRKDAGGGTGASAATNEGRS
jgi:signal transduction histidine kinase